jgi:hypothetical protein
VAQKPTHSTSIPVFNILKDSILETVGNKTLQLSHPPYHNMIAYSGSEWGRGGEEQASRVVVLPYCRDSCPAMVQLLNRNLSEVDLLSHVKSNS